MGKVGTGFDAGLLRELHATFEKIRRDSCPFSNLPETKSARYGQTISSAEMRRCRWVEPKMVCEVRFSEWTRDLKLRQPVFLGIRADKSAEEVVREKAR